MRDVVILTGRSMKETASRPLQVAYDGIGDPSYLPHFRFLGAYQIAHALRKENITTQVVDYIQYITPEHLLKLTEKFIHKDKPTILGVSTTFLSNTGKLLPSNVRFVIKTLKEKYPLLKVVLGGALAHKYDIKENQIDHAIAAYAEDITIELFNGLLGRTKLNPDFKLSKRISRNNTVYDITKCDHRFIDMDCIRPNEALPIELSRGCIFKCSFCRYPFIGKKKNDYTRDMALVAEEMMYNYEKFGTTNYYILDDTFNETPDKVHAFCDAVNSLPFKIKWTAYLRLDLLARFPELATVMMDSGLCAAFFGIESFHPEASKAVGKGWNGKPEAKEFIQKLKTDIWKGKVRVTLSLIMGIPPEDFDSIKETHQWCLDNQIDSIGWHVLGLKRNPSLDSSEFEKNPEKWGITLIGKDDWHNGYNPKSEVDGWYKEIVGPLYENRSKMFDNVICWTIIEMTNYITFDEAWNINTASEETKQKVIDGRMAYVKQYVKMLADLNE